MYHDDHHDHLRADDDGMAHPPPPITEIPRLLTPWTKILSDFEEKLREADHSLFEASRPLCDRGNDRFDWMFAEVYGLRCKINELRHRASIWREEG